MRLAGKIGIVTAAASGMGRAGALRFAKEGAAVAVADIDAAGVSAVVGEITAAGGRRIAVSQAIGQSPEPRRAAEELLRVLMQAPTRNQRSEVRSQS